MTASAPLPTNPYIGPRSFETGERLFGRDREVRDLLHLLIAERIVLLHSPSGAGKSSLVKAALIPALERKDFTPLPPVRVNQELPPGAPPGANRYVYSTLLSLEERFAPEARLPVAELAAARLDDYLQRRLLPPVRAAERDPVLLFDQFEELLTVAPTELAAKHAFFEQLGQALADRQLWALFAMREDYLAALDPYLVPIPNRFKDTFRLDLLGAEAARQAMQGPAKAAGVVFSTPAAARLADDLRRTRVQQPDGSSAEVLGPYVEPVQLQVVCLRLWERRFASGAPARMPVITPDDISDVGDVDSALAGYYEERVRAVAAAAGVRERSVRDWVDRELITAQGQRGQVMRGAGSSAGLDNRAIAGLIDAHLLRADQRHGVVWYELAHDRLVAPVQQSNAAWRAATLTPFQRQAVLWDEQGRGEGLLLQGAELAEAEQWAQANADTLTEEERAFLAACQQARAVRQQQERANRRIRQTLVGAVLAALAAIGLAGLAFQQRQIAQQKAQQARLAQLRQLVALAQSEMQQKPQFSLLLALSATQSLQPDDPPISTVRASLITLLSHIGGEVWDTRSAPLSSLVFNRQGTRLAGAAAQPLLWRFDSPASAPALLSAGELPLEVLGFSPDDKWLLGTNQGQLVRWQVDAPQRAPIVPRDASPNTQKALISPDGRWLANLTYDGTVQIWPMQALDTAPRVHQLDGRVISDLSFGADGLVLLGQDGLVRVWVFDAPTQPVLDLQLRPTAPLTSTDSTDQPHYALSADGRRVAVAGADGTVQLWQVVEGQQDALILKGVAGSLQQILFSPDHTWLATLNDQGVVMLWNVSTPDQAAIKLQGGPTTQPLVFSPDSRYLAAPGGSNLIQIWTLDQPQAAPVLLRGHEQWVTTLAFSPDSKLLMSSDQAGSIRRWQLEQPYPGRLILPVSAPPVAFSPDGQWLVTDDGTAALWQLQQTGVVSYALTGAAGQLTTFAFSPDGRWLVANSDSAPARLWAISDRHPSEVSMSSDIQSIEFNPNNTFVIGRTAQGEVQFFHTEQSRLVPLQTDIHIQGVESLKFSPDGNLLATSSNSYSTLSIWSTKSFKKLAEIPNQQAYPHSFAFSPNSEWLSTTSTTGSAQIWHIDPETIKPVSIPADAVAVAFHPKEPLLAIAHTNGSLQLWHLDGSTATPLGRPIQNDILGTFQFSPDGTWLSVARPANQMEEGRIAVWRVSPQAEHPLVFHGDRSWGYIQEFSPDSHWMASDNNKGVLSLWQPGALFQDQLALSNLDQAPASSQNPARASAARISPDGTWLAVSQQGVPTTLWHLRWRDPVMTACHIAGRNLSLEEWQQHIDLSAPYQKICPDLPYNPAVYLDLLKRQRLDQALRYYAEDLRANPNLDPPAVWLTKQAAALLQEKRLISFSSSAPSFYYNEAMAAYERALQVDPALLDQHMNEFATLCLLGANPAPTKHILDACDRAVQQEPNSGYVYAFRGKARGLAGDLKGAQADLEHAQGLITEQGPGTQSISEWLDVLKQGNDPFKAAAQP